MFDIHVAQLIAQYARGVQMQVYNPPGESGWHNLPQYKDEVDAARMTGDFTFRVNPNYAESDKVPPMVQESLDKRKQYKSMLKMALDTSPGPVRDEIVHKLEVEIMWRKLYLNSCY